MTELDEAIERVKVWQVQISCLGFNHACETLITAAQRPAPEVVTAAQFAQTMRGQRYLHDPSWCQIYTLLKENGLRIIKETNND